MLKESADLEAEVTELGRFLAARAPADFARVTQFKDYTVDDVLRHLHQGDFMGLLAVDDPDGFRRWYDERRKLRAAGLSMRDDARLQFGALSGATLVDAWRRGALDLARRLAAMPQGARIPWAGPDMGVRMFTSARQMEVWAHGQEIYDILGAERPATDRLRNIAELGVRTFGYTFTVRRLPVPDAPPHVRLTAPSGETWTWNPPSQVNLVEGPALDFCQVVTQVRNVADTSLRADGDDARRWLSIAQCFAGGAQAPPAPGTRYRVQ